MTCLYAVRVHSCIIETEVLASHLRAVDVCSASEVKTWKSANFDLSWDEVCYFFMCIHNMISVLIQEAWTPKVCVWYIYIYIYPIHNVVYIFTHISTMLFCFLENQPCWTLDSEVPMPISLQLIWTAGRSGFTNRPSIFDGRASGVKLWLSSMRLWKSFYTTNGEVLKSSKTAPRNHLSPSCCQHQQVPPRGRN